MRTVRAISAIAAMLAACLSGCSSSPEGSALRSWGFGGEPFFDHVEPGARYGVAFPLIKNVTAHPVVIDSVQLSNLPGGVRVVGMRALPNPKHNYIVLSREGSGALGDYRRYPDLFHPGKTAIPPHSLGGMYFAVDLRSKRRDPGMASGCLISYHLQGQTQPEHQTFACEYGLGRDAPSD